MSTQTAAEHVYALGHSRDELERLSRQAQAFAPFTRQLLVEAGLTQGMRVLDIGCGSGDVAFLAADLVGPSGQVVGVDRAPAAVEWAQTRAHLRAANNVKFIPGDPVALELGGAFDALIGRLVLMYYPDPVDALRRLLRHVRPEGLVVFQEFDFANCRSHPCMPLFDRSVALIRHTLTATGAKPHLGLQLYSVFSNAGLPGPAMRMDAVVGGGPDIAAYDLVAEVIQSLLPTMERLNIATATELQVPTLAQRLRKEVAEARAVVLSPGLIGAWSRRTAAS